MNTEDSPKTRILTLCKGQFLEHGFAHSSIEDLVALLGISKKTFYKCFRGKEELVSEIIFSVRDEIKGKFESIIASDLRFTEKLHEVMSVLGVQSSRIGKAFQQDLHRAYPHVWVQIEDFRRQTMFTNLTFLLEQGKREGAVREDVNIRLALLMYTSAVDRILRPDVLAHESFSMHEALRNIMGMFFHGILTGEASRELDEYPHTIRTHPL